MAERVDYDRVAPDFDRRYRGGEPAGVARALRRAVTRIGARRVLEVGCGTGHWLRAFGAPAVCGADRSLGMLARAVAAPGLAVAPASIALVGADAGALPFAGPCFDLVACINAIHHFPSPRLFLDHGTSLLRDGGCLLVVGLDPASRRDRWYLYDHFPETLPLDRARYPAHADLRRWMRERGLVRVHTRLAQRLSGAYRGGEVFEDPILHRHGTSQLTLLDDDAFGRGMRSLRDTVASRGRDAVFVTDLRLPVTCGYRPAGGARRRQRRTDRG